MGTCKVYCPLPERQEAWLADREGEDPGLLQEWLPGVNRNTRARPPLPTAVAPDRRAP